MSRRFLLAACLALVAGLAVDSRAVAQNTQADDFADLQDLIAEPPVLDSQLDGIVGWAASNGSFEHLGGPPFQAPLSQFLPAGVRDVIIKCRSGSRQISAVPRCVRYWYTCYVELVFADDSLFTFKKRIELVICNNGTTSLDDHYSMSPAVGPPGNRGNVHLLYEQRRQGALIVHEQRLRARLGATADFQNQNGVPVVSGGPLTIEIAPGAALDLRQNAAAAGPIFITDGPALLRCDTVLMDPGVVLTDLFNFPPVVQPATLIVDEDVVLPQFCAQRSTQPGSVDAFVWNDGHVDQQLQFTWTGAFTLPGQTVVAVAAGAVQRIQIPVAIPVATPPGAAASLQLQWSSLSQPGHGGAASMLVVNEHPGQFRYGTGTPGGNGPLTIDADGPLAAGGPTVRVTSTGTDPGALGMAMLGLPVNRNYGTWMLPGFPAELYIDPQGFLFVTILLVADAAGSTTFGLQIANVAALRGLKIDCQTVHLPGPGQQPLVLGGTPALSMTVQ
ncbi:MAG: hypothetical protein KDC98_13095 [Planctomycetes bacterium]|nr:hypothetical protein [Planctomycetota bacterium]